MSSVAAAAAAPFKALDQEASVLQFQLQRLKLPELPAVPSPIDSPVVSSLRLKLPELPAVPSPAASPVVSNLQSTLQSALKGAAGEGSKGADGAEAEPSLPAPLAVSVAANVGLALFALSAQRKAAESESAVSGRLGKEVAELKRAVVAEQMEVTRERQLAAQLKEQAAREAEEAARLLAAEKKEAEVARRAAAAAEAAATAEQRAVVAFRAESDGLKEKLRSESMRAAEAEETVGMLQKELSASEVKADETAEELQRVRLDGRLPPCCAPCVHQEGREGGREGVSTAWKTCAAVCRGWRVLSAATDFWVVCRRGPCRPFNTALLCVISH